VFAAFDAAKHGGPFGRSPSVQIRASALRAAIQEGLAFSNKGKGEIAVGVRPDMLIEYARHANEIHQVDTPALPATPADEAPPGDFTLDDSTLAILPEARRIVLRNLRQRVRKANFQRDVLAAYNHQCALCRTQLDLVEAAHVIPVAHPQSVDIVSNGVALCVLHHRAYDRSLVTFALVEHRFRLALNAREIDRLQQNGLLGGYEHFRQNLWALYIPERERDRLRPDYVRIGNEIRGWGTFDLEAQDTQSDIILLDV